MKARCLPCVLFCSVSVEDNSDVFIFKRQIKPVSTLYVS